MNDNHILEVNITDIVISDRIRREVGDLTDLAESMSQGLLQPIGITSDSELVFGLRRLMAARDILRWDTISAKIVDVQSVLHGQFAENLLRKEYTISERVAIVDALRSYEHGGDRRSDQALICDNEKPTLDQLAKKAGLGGKDGYHRAKAVVENGIPEVVDAMDSGSLSISAAAALASGLPDEQAECLKKDLDGNRLTSNIIRKNLRHIQNEKSRKQLEEQAATSFNPEEAIRIYHCAFQNLEVTAGIEPESVDLIFTDIPYGKDFLPELDDLGDFAQRILKPSGLFVTYCGQYGLQDALASFCKFLKYKWTICSCWEGNASQLNVGDLRVFSNWKPILVFSKGQFPEIERFHDFSCVNSREKDWHEWQQPLKEAEKYISIFSQLGDLVVDPCGGGFTTALACQNLNRRFIGCDIDYATVINGQKRLRHEGKISLKAEDVPPIIKMPQTAVFH